MSSPPVGHPAEGGEGEEPKVSLLDVVVQEYLVDKDKRTSRLMLCAELPDSNTEEITRFYNEFSSHHRDTAFTGVMFILNNQAVLQLVESSTETLNTLLRTLQNPPNRKPLFKRCRVCSFTEEMPREFRSWSIRSLRQPNEEMNPLQDWTKVTFDLLRHLLEMGREIVSMPEEKAIEFITTSQSKQFLARIPSAERVLAVCGQEDIYTIDEYLEAFDAPIDHVLESERVWPVDPFLRY